MRVHSSRTLKSLSGGALHCTSILMAAKLCLAMMLSTDPAVETERLRCARKSCGTPFGSALEVGVLPSRNVLKFVAKYQSCNRDTRKPRQFLVLLRPTIRITNYIDLTPLLAKRTIWTMDGFNFSASQTSSGQLRVLILPAATGGYCNIHLWVSVTSKFVPIPIMLMSTSSNHPYPKLCSLSREKYVGQFLGRNISARFERSMFPQGLTSSPFPGS